jgi:hypothetical protein
MEKLIYVVWKAEALSEEAFRQELADRTAGRLVNAGTRRLELSVADEHVRFARSARISRSDPPISGIICLWLDTHLHREACEAIIDEVTDRAAGYLVLESQPIVNTTHVVPVGERTPGVNTVGFLEKPARLEYADWLELWQGSHTQIAIDTQSTFFYVQNAVVRTLTKDAPAWAAIVEEGFPRDAFVDPKIFYDAGESEELLVENRTRMIESCRRFIDFDRLESLPLSHYVLRVRDD